LIILDTHIWVGWVHGGPRLTASHEQLIGENEEAGLGISAISCWEVAKLVEKGRLVLPRPIADWLQNALAYPGITLMQLTPEIAVESTMLPGGFHKDPADQIIVATARIHDCLLVTEDQEILDYPHVQTR